MMKKGPLRQLSASDDLVNAHGLKATGEDFLKSDPQNMCAGPLRVAGFLFHLKINIPLGMLIFNREKADMILHYSAISPNCRRALAVALDLGFELELRKAIPESPELVKINPNGRIPVLEDGDLVLWESNAIMQYLADKKGSELFPRDLKKRADVTRWQFWTVAHFDPACGPLLWEAPFKKFFTGEGPDPAAVSRAIQDFHPWAAVLDRHLQGREFLVDDRITLADYSVAAALMYLRASRIPLEEHPNAMRWFQRIEAQDAWKRSGEAIPGIIEK
jgi:glutathione S-transferase